MKKEKGKRRREKAAGCLPERELKITNYEFGPLIHTDWH